ncbi:MAG: ABC transporter ATP-binding protein [Burkholderiales bacterium]|nr:ABC transporter ATP-binding protein [Burkholderiales bacterium]
MTAPLLRVEDLVAGYAPGLPVVHGASLEASAGEIVTLIGPNGAGKSTLLKAIAGLVTVERGSIRIAGCDVVGLPAHEIVRLGVGYVPQTGNVFTTLTVLENLKVGGHLLAPAQRAERLAQAFTRFPVLAERRRALARTLSGGQRQMLAIARALMTAPRLLLLDEPSAGLAPVAAEGVFAELRSLARSGVAVLMVEQRARAALRVSDRGYVLAEGRNRVAGPAATLLSDPDVAAAFLGGRRAA